jgi:Flp pilus assembly protein TadD
METNPRERSDVHSARPQAIPAGSQPGANTLHPHLLLVRWEISSRRQDWASACNAAQALIAALPNDPIGWIYRSFALQQLGRLQDARDGLLAAARRFPADWRIAFNLASYVSLLGDHAGAWNWLDRAAELGNAETVKRLALDAPAFRALWPTLGRQAEAGPPSAHA